MVRWGWWKPERAKDRKRERKSGGATKPHDEQQRKKSTHGAAGGQVLAVPAEGAAQDGLVMHHELILSLVRQVLAQPARVEVPNLTTQVRVPTNRNRGVGSGSSRPAGERGISRW